MFSGQSFVLGLLAGAGAAVMAGAIFLANLDVAGAQPSDAPRATSRPTNVPSETATGERQAPYRTTVTELARAYRANELQADAQIAGRTIEVAGIVRAIALEHGDRIVVQFAGHGAAYTQAVMEMEPSEVRAAQELIPGDSAVVLCKAMRRNYGTPRGSGCSFVRIVPASIGEIRPADSAK